jgi:hypothetical protein
MSSNSNNTSLNKKVIEAQKRIREQAEQSSKEGIPFPDHRELTPKEAEQFKAKSAVDFKKLRQNPAGGCDF